MFDSKQKNQSVVNQAFTFATGTNHYITYIKDKLKCFFKTSHFFLGRKFEAL